MATTFGGNETYLEKSHVYRRLVVQLVLLSAINIAAEAAFAKSGLLHLFSSEARFPSVSESVNSPSLVLGGLRSRALPRTYYAKVSRSGRYRRVSLHQPAAVPERSGARLMGGRIAAAMLITAMGLA
jgi:hypothetical protein